MLVIKSILISLITYLFIGCGGSISQETKSTQSIEQEQELLMYKNKDVIDLSDLNALQESKLIRGER